MKQLSGKLDAGPSGNAQVLKSVTEILVIWTFVRGQTRKRFEILAKEHENYVNCHYLVCI